MDMMPRSDPSGAIYILKPELRGVLTRMGFTMSDAEFDKLWNKFVFLMVSDSRIRVHVHSNGITHVHVQSNGITHAHVQSNGITHAHARVLYNGITHAHARVLYNGITYSHARVQCNHTHTRIYTNPDNYNYISIQSLLSSHSFMY